MSSHIREAIKREYKSQSIFALCVGVNRADVTNYLNGRKKAIGVGHRRAIRTELQRAGIIRTSNSKGKVKPGKSGCAK